MAKNPPKISSLKVISRVFPFKFQHILITSVFGLCVRFTFKTCQIVAGISMIRQFHEIFILMFGGFLMLGPTMCRRPSIGTLRRRRYAGRVAVVAACQTAVHRADPPKGVERILNCVISPCRPSSTKIYSHRLGMVDINRQKVSCRATPPWLLRMCMMNLEMKQHFNVVQEISSD